MNTFRVRVLAAIAATMFVLLVGAAGYRYFSAERLAPPEVLASQALSESASEAERVEAALELLRHGGAAQPQMRTLLVEGRDSDVRAMAVQGLMDNGDWDDVPRLIDALDDPSPWVRTRAARAVWKLLGTNFSYNPHDSSERRADTIRRIKEEYKWRESYRQDHHQAPGVNVSRKLD
jgi:hypothetical protein